MFKSYTLPCVSLLIAITTSSFLFRTEVTAYSKKLQAFNWRADPAPGLDEFYNQCGKTKGCVALPYECIDSQNCDMMATYKKFNDSILEIEIYGKVTGDEYVAFGFSTDIKMGNDSIVECVLFGDVANAHQSYNMPGADDNKRLPAPLFEVTDSMYVDGYVYCRVQHPIKFINNNQDFDLRQPYHLLMATGPADSTNIKEHKVEKASSDMKAPASDTSVLYFDPASRVLKQLHGSFMVIAWLMAASIGVLMPRYMKRTWVGKQIMKKDRWFIFHQGLMAVAWTLTVAAFIIIFVDLGGWISESVSENPHPLLGCITTGLAFIQPFMAALRPSPLSSKRYIFNWAHLFVGYSAHILAITTIFLAVEMGEAEMPFYTYWILTAHICVYVAAHIALTILARRKPKMTAGDVMKDDTSDEKGSSMRKIILVVYAIIVVGLGITVIAFIAAA